MATKKGKKSKAKKQAADNRSTAISQLPQLAKGWHSITEIAKMLRCGRRGVYRPIRAALKAKALKRVKVGMEYYFARTECKAAAPSVPEKPAKKAAKKGNAKPAKASKARKAKAGKTPKKSRVKSKSVSPDKPKRQRKSAKPTKTPKGNGTKAPSGSGTATGSQATDAGKTGLPPAQPAAPAASGADLLK